MIDAYEIGIQLILQEDVSAGLAVINGELAEVDRAIAATSADLVGLAKEADTATKAVAAATVSNRVVPVATTDQVPSVTTERAAQHQEGEATVPLPAMTPGEKAAAPEKKAAETPMLSTSPTGSPPKDEQRLPQPDFLEETVSSNAPIAKPAAEQEEIEQRVKNTQADPGTPVFVAPIPVSPAPPHTAEFPPPFVRAGATAGQEPRRSVTPPTTPVALTASISRVQRPEVSEAPPTLYREQSTGGPVPRRERPAAPWSSVDHRSGARAEATRLHEKATAPEFVGEKQKEAGGGTVMLEGRLVGQWLSQHMGREASRPPAGTSFFDPRQTPAWNVSGAL